MSLQVSMADINTEVGYTNNATTSLNDSRVRKLATRSSGPISFSDCAYGIGVPGVFTFGASTFAPSYGAAGDGGINLSVFDGTGESLALDAGIAFSDNGTLTYSVSDYTGTTPFSRTWLIDGINSQYTAKFDVTSGTLHSNSSDPGLDLPLSSNLTWFIVLQGPPFNERPPNAPFWNGYKQTTGILTFKRSGTTLITRNVTLTLSAGLGDGGDDELQPPNEN